MKNTDETSNLPAAARGLAPCEDTLIREVLEFGARDAAVKDEAND